MQAWARVLLLLLLLLLLLSLLLSGRDGRRVWYDARH